MRENKIDILTIQESRTIKEEKTSEFNVLQIAATHKNSEKYLSAGQILLVKKEIIITKDVERSSEHINIFDLTNKMGANILKIISIYGQPEKKTSIFKKLHRQLNQFIRTEPCSQTIILGDFNIDFSNENRSSKDIQNNMNELGYK